MAEEDYEVDESGKKKIHKLRLSVEELMPLEDKRSTARGASGGSGAASKQSKRKRSPSPTVKGAKRKR